MGVELGDSEMPRPKVFRVLKLPSQSAVRVQQSWVHLHLFWCTWCLCWRHRVSKQIPVNQLQHLKAKIESNELRSEEDGFSAFFFFQTDCSFKDIRIFISRVQYSVLFRFSFDCVEPKVKRCVCAQGLSPEGSSAGSCSITPLIGPEWQTQPALKSWSTNYSFLDNSAGSMKCLCGLIGGNFADSLGPAAFLFDALVWCDSGPTAGWVVRFKREEKKNPVEAKKDTQSAPRELQVDAHL